jgi:hypothetical protein
MEPAAISISVSVAKVPSRQQQSTSERSEPLKQMPDVSRRAELIRILADMIGRARNSQEPAKGGDHELN